MTNMVKARSHMRATYQHKYGISLEDYEIRAERQEYLCAICGEQETATRSGKTKCLAVDHNHETGEIRELLCQRCNMILGMINEDIELLEKMKFYLKKWNT